MNIHKELDFVLEVANAEKCKAMLAKDNPLIKIPKNYHSYSDSKIIVMEFIDGIPILDISRLKEEGFNLAEIARAISKCFCQMIFIDGFVHADPH